MYIGFLLFLGLFQVIMAKPVYDMNRYDIPFIFSTPIPDKMISFDQHMFQLGGSTTS